MRLDRPYIQPLAIAGSRRAAAQRVALLAAAALLTICLWSGAPAASAAEASADRTTQRADRTMQHAVQHALWALAPQSAHHVRKASHRARRKLRCPKAQARRTAGLRRAVANLAHKPRRCRPRARRKTAPATRATPRPPLPMSGGLGDLAPSAGPSSSPSGNEAPAQGTLVTPVVPHMPINVSAPTIAGTAKQGMNLEASTGEWTESPTSYVYVWQDCNAQGEDCTNAAGPIGATYELGAGDVGHTVRVLVTATNTVGSRSQVSAPTAEVSPAGLTCAVTATPGMGANAIASAIVTAADGSTVCLASGVYPLIHLVGAEHHSYVTVRPAAGATATVAGMEVQNSSFLRFQDLHMTAGFNMRDVTTLPASHDYQFIENTFEEPLYGIVLNGSVKPIKKVAIERNFMRHVHLERGEVGGKCDAGYAEGQDVTLYYAEGVTIAHNTFKQAEWHYIQGGSAGGEGVVVEHNLFEGHIYLACSHLNVWQIYSGGVDDTFAHNVVRGESGKDASVIGLIFENGAGGLGCSTTMTNSNVSDNLFVDAAEGYNVMLFTTKNLTYSHNTIVRGEWGQWLDRSSFCGAGENLTAEHNIGVETESPGSPQRFVFGECKGSCLFEYNVSDDATANGLGAAHYLNGWKPSWTTTAWNPATEPSPPAGYYTPVGLPFAAGYEGGVGP